MESSTASFHASLLMRDQRLCHNETPTELASSVVENEEEWKSLVQELRKDGFVTMMGIQQALSQGALGSIKTFENDCSSSCKPQTEQHQKVCRRLSASSLERAVKKMLLSNPQSLEHLTTLNLTPNEQDVVQSSGRSSSTRGESETPTNTNIYTLKVPIETKSSRSSLVSKLETALNLSSLADEALQRRDQ